MKCREYSFRQQKEPSKTGLSATNPLIKGRAQVPMVFSSSLMLNMW
jgi:hypothetical protein